MDLREAMRLESLVKYIFPADMLKYFEFIKVEM